MASITVDSGKGVAILLCMREILTQSLRMPIACKPLLEELDDKEGLQDLELLENLLSKMRKRYRDSMPDRHYPDVSLEKAKLSASLNGEYL